MTFVWLTPLSVFVLFSSVIIFQESIREKSLAAYEWELSESRNVGANSPTIEPARQ